jgi:hypothetical protein
VKALDGFSVSFNSLISFFVVCIHNYQNFVIANPVVQLINVQCSTL